VDAVEPVGVHVIREPAGAADAGDEHEFLARNAERGEDFLHLCEDGVVAAARAPADFLIAAEILRREHRQAIGRRRGGRLRHFNILQFEIRISDLHSEHLVDFLH
jgi:hypothetical protein